MHVKLLYLLPNTEFTTVPISPLPLHPCSILTSLLKTDFLHCNPFGYIHINRQGQAVLDSSQSDSSKHISGVWIKLIQTETDIKNCGKSKEGIAGIVRQKVLRQEV